MSLIQRTLTQFQWWLTAENQIVADRAWQAWIAHTDSERAGQ